MKLTKEGTIPPRNTIFTFTNAPQQQKREHFLEKLKKSHSIASSAMNKAAFKNNPNQQERRLTLALFHACFPHPFLQYEL